MSVHTIIIIMILIIIALCVYTYMMTNKLSYGDLFIWMLRFCLFVILVITAGISMIIGKLM